MVNNLEKDSIITLDDNSEYALLDETIVNNKKYFFAVLIDENTGNPTTTYDIFEEEIEGKDIYMNTVSEGDFKQSLLLEFSKKYMESIDNIKE